MSKMTIRLVVFFLALIYPLFSFAGECRITILHFNDLHGHLATPKKGLGGAERIGALVARIDQENAAAGRHTLLLMGGDLISGTPVSGKFKGEAEFKFLEKIGTEAMGFGNHEFDFGVPSLKKNMKSVDVPVLSANIIDKDTKRLFGKATYNFPLGPGCNVGVMGLVTKNVPIMTAGDVGGLVFQDPIKYAGYYIDDLVDQNNVRIALTHLGVGGDVNLAKSVPGFDLIVGGHDHVDKEEYCRVTNGVTVCQTPAKGRYLGRIDIVAKNGRVDVEKTELIPVDKKAGKSKEIRAFLKPYMDDLQVAMSEVVTTIDKDLYHRPKKGVVSQVPLGSVTTDAMRSCTGADVAFINVGGIRKTLKKGKITKNDIFEALPFENYVGVLNVTGNDLLKIIEISERNARPERPQPFLNWSGLDYEKSNGSLIVSVNGKKLDENKVYKVATVDFLASGGDGYYVLKGKEFKASGKVVRDVVERYMKDNEI